MPERKKRTGKNFGLHVSDEDIKWLERAANHWGEIPGYNRSRLIAMALVTPSENNLVLTEKGQALLSSRAKAKDSGDAN